jgi:hypothetical protein
MGRIVLFPLAFRASAFIAISSMIMTAIAMTPASAGDSEYQKYLDDYTKKLVREQEMRNEVQGKCWPAGNPVKHPFECELAIETKYGATDAAASTRRSLAQSEKFQRQMDVNNETFACYKGERVATARCEIAVYTKYGMAKELASAKQELVKAEEQQREQKASAAREEDARKQEEARCQQTPSASIGMTTDQVTSSKWGYPSNRHTATTASHRREQWVYEYGPKCDRTFKRSYLYLDDGILSSIED